MIQAYSRNIAVTPNTAIPFNTTKLKTGCVVTQSDDRKTFYLNRAGIYMIEFNGSGASTAGGSVAVQMKVDGIDVEPAVAEITTEANAPSEIAFNTLVSVDRVCACMGGKPLQVMYTGTAGAMPLANIIITKIR